MSLVRFRSAAALALCSALVFVAGAGDAQAQQKKITRLGSPGTRITAPIKDTAALQKTFATKRNQASISRVLDRAGLTGLTPQVMSAIVDGKVTETSVAPGTSISWMATRKNGRPDIISDGVWAGTKAFDGFAFTVEDGLKRYNFVVPKACGNLALVNVTEVPLPECVHVAVSRNCETKETVFTASGTAISTGQATKVSVFRDGNKVGEMLPGGSFKLTMGLREGRYTFMATDKYGREYGTCERDLTVQACAVPPPPEPPPAPTSCGALVTATRAKGGINIAVDGSASAAGASPAARVAVKLIGPDGSPIAYTHDGKQQTESELAPPFKATFFVAKAKPGTYTLRGMATAGNPKAEPKSCESTVYVPETDNVDWFFDGAFGKQRRNYEMSLAAPAAGTVEAGFCDPMIGLKAGPLFWFKEHRVSVAPAAGIGFMFGDLGDYDYDPNEYNNASIFLEAVANYHFSPRGGFIGTGLGWWDVFDGDHNTANWILTFGAPITGKADTSRLFLIGEGRVFFDSPDGVDNNYQFWGGVRYVFK
jgi:hypothetical protein